MAADKAPAQRAFGIGGRRIGVVLPDIDAIGITARGHAHIEYPRQCRHRAQRLVRAERRMRRAPAPLARIIAVGSLQLVQRAGQRLPGLLLAAQRRAPPGVIAREDSFQPGAEVPLAVAHGKALLANARNHQGARQLVGPDREDQRLGPVPLHLPVEVRQQLLCLRCQGVARSGLAQHRQQGPGGQGLHIVLDRRHAGHIMLVGGRQQLLYALVAVGQAPVLGQEMRVAGFRHALVGRGHKATRSAIVLRRLLVAQPALPVIARIPAGRGRHAAQVIAGRTHRRPACGLEADMALHIGRHNALHG